MFGFTHASTLKDALLQLRKEKGELWAGAAGGEWLFQSDPCVSTPRLLTLFS